MKQIRFRFPVLKLATAAAANSTNNTRCGMARQGLPKLHTTTELNFFVANKLPKLYIISKGRAA